MSRRFCICISSALAALTALASTSCGGAETSGSSPGGTIAITASGEALALGGYGFPPAAGDVSFVDGWEVKFTELIVALDKVTISESPDMDPGDQSRTGHVVAEVDGPWVVDLHRGGPIPGKGGAGEQAVAIATIENQNKNGGDPFEPDQRYAFGYDVVTAVDSAKNVNLDAQGEADFELMKQKGYSVLYAGTATFKGGAACAPADPVFDKLPKVVNFKLGFKSPTSYSNCQNPDNDPAKPLGDDEHERGIIVKANQAVTAQITIHTDHPFWEAFTHDSPAHFDPIAARLVGAAEPATATLEEMIGVDPTAISAKDGSPLPWRSCTADYTPPDAEAMHFDTTGIPVNLAGDPRTSIRDLYDFMTYAQSTQGHLNADGLCSVKRRYPSPP